MTTTDLRTQSPESLRPDESDPALGGRRRSRWSAASGTADPRWVRPALLLLLAGTAVLYLWNLGASGYGNTFYAAAVQAGTKSWKAFFFGSSDWSNSITVDKPPASLWVMALSGRIFGFSSWSMLGPQALAGVATVGVLYATVRRWSGPVAGLVAGTAMALTPVAALMFRFNNPDALLTLMLVLGAYCVVRALENGSTKWLVLAGTAVGFAFLTKMMQAFLVLPAFGLVYLVCAPTSLRRRILGVLAGAAAVAVSAGWWVAAVELWPASSRPWIGGSSKNSELDLIFGYNGFGRIFGGDGNPGGTGTGGGGRAGGGAGGFSGATGWTRLFNDTMGTEISWLIPAALIALVGGLWVTRRAPRTDRIRASLLLWGTWTLVTGAVFSFSSGIIHEYYTVALAPGLAALVAAGGTALWRDRAAVASRILLGSAVAVTGLWSFFLLRRTPNWYPEIRWIVLIAALAATVALVVGGRLLAKVAAGVALAAAVGLLGAPAAYAADTASTPHTGSTPRSGPAATSGGGLGGPGGTFTRTAPSGTAPSATGTQGGQLPGGGELPSGGQFPGGGSTPSASGDATRRVMTGGMGAVTVNSALTKLLQSGNYRWAAATVGSQSAASLQLTSDEPVMAIGGFNGGDPSPTLAQFKAYVAAKKIHYFVGSGGVGGGGPSGGRGSSSEIATWVAAHFTAKTVGGQTVYDLTQPTS